MAQAQSVSGFEYRGITHVSWWFDEYTYSAATASRNDLAAVNFNWTGVLVTWYQPTIQSTTIAPSTTQTPTDAAVRQAIRDLHAKGIKVMLKPHVDTNDGHWRGEIDPADKDAWFTSYTAFLMKYAQLAADESVEMLCIGTELKAMSGAVNQARWGALADTVRSAYPGTLTYAANASGGGDEFTTVSFWNKVDLIGLDAYFQLTKKADPSLAEAVAAWRGNANKLDLVSAVRAVSTANSKPVIFTEIGYKSASGANTEPWNYSHAGAYDPEEQRNCVDAAYTVWSANSDWMKGIFWWAWPVPAPGASDLDYNPRGKPAAEVMRAWHAAPGGANAVTNSAGFNADAVAPGSAVTLWGNGLSGGTTAAAAIPLPLKLADTTVTFDGIPAPLYFASPGQVNAQLPFEIAPGMVTAEIRSSAGTTVIRFRVANAAPGVFAVFDANTFGGDIRAGSYIAIYCTGLGAVMPSVTTGSAAAAGAPATLVIPEVRVDGVPVPVAASVLAPSFVGLYQVNALLPPSLAAGAHKLELAAAGAVSNAVMFTAR